MKSRLFDELMQSMREAREHSQRKRELRTAVLPVAPTAMSAEHDRSLEVGMRDPSAVFVGLAQPKRPPQKTTETKAP